VTGDAFESAGGLHSINGTRVAIVDIGASAARPHFTGTCYVREAQSASLWCL